MFLLFERFESDGALLIHLLKKECILCLAVVIVTFLIGVDFHEALEFYCACRCRKYDLPRIKLYGKCLKCSSTHTACSKTLPDKVVESVLISGKISLDFIGSIVDICGTDGFVSILDLMLCVTCCCLLSRISLVICGKEFLTVVSLNILLCHFLCKVGYTGGIGTKIRDKSRSALSFYCHAFIELLGDLHSLLC